MKVINKRSTVNGQEGKVAPEWQTGIALYSFNRFPFPETLDMSKKANDVKLSSGVIDYEAVIAELNRQGFDGSIYVEY